MVILIMVIRIIEDGHSDDTSNKTNNETNIGHSCDTNKDTKMVA